MSGQICTHCSVEKDKIFLKTYRGTAIYADKDGNRWYGSKCPDCYKEWKLEYDTARRLLKGHVPIGTELACPTCLKPHKLENGGCRECKECRGK